MRYFLVLQNVDGPNGTTVKKGTVLSSDGAFVLLPDGTPLCVICFQWK